MRVSIVKNFSPVDVNKKSECPSDITWNMSDVEQEGRGTRATWNKNIASTACRRAAYPVVRLVEHGSFPPPRGLRALRAPQAVPTPVSAAKEPLP